MKRLRERRLDEATDIELFNKLRKQFPKAENLTQDLVTRLAKLDPESTVAGKSVPKTGTMTTMLVEFFAGFKPGDDGVRRLQAWIEPLKTIMKSSAKATKFRSELADLLRYKKQLQAMGHSGLLKDFESYEELTKVINLLRFTDRKFDPSKITIKSADQKAKTTDPRLLGYTWAKTDKWELISPLSFAGSKFFGTSSWCTARTQGYYNSYNKAGGLFILRSLENPEEKYQLSNTGKDSFTFNDNKNHLLYREPEALKQWCETEDVPTEWVDKIVWQGEWYNRYMNDNGELMAEQKAEIKAERAAQPKAERPTSDKASETVDFKKAVQLITELDVDFLYNRLLSDKVFVTWLKTQNFGWYPAVDRLVFALWWDRETRASGVVKVPKAAFPVTNLPLGIQYDGRYTLESLQRIMNPVSPHAKKYSSFMTIPEVRRKFAAKFQQEERNGPPELRKAYAALSVYLEHSGNESGHTDEMTEAWKVLNNLAHDIRMSGTSLHIIDRSGDEGWQELNLSPHEFQSSSPDPVTTSLNNDPELQGIYNQMRGLPLRACPTFVETPEAEGVLAFSVKRILRAYDVWTRIMYGLWYLQGFNDIAARYMGLKAQVERFPTDGSDEDREALAQNAEHHQNLLYPMVTCAELLTDIVVATHEGFLTNKMRDALAPRGGESVTVANELSPELRNQGWLVLGRKRPRVTQIRRWDLPSYIVQKCINASDLPPGTTGSVLGISGRKTNDLIPVYNDLAKRVEARLTTIYIENFEQVWQYWKGLLESKLPEIREKGAAGAD